MTKSAQVTDEAKAPEQKAPEHKSVFDALIGAMADVGSVRKEYNQRLGYNIATEASFLAEVRPAMLRHGLTLVPVAMERLSSEVFTNKNGVPMNQVCIRTTYQLTHAPTGTWVTIQTLGEGMDAGDKATNKSMTVALKYAMRQTLLVETGDDPDMFPSGDQQRQDGATKQQPAKQTNLPARGQVAKQPAKPAAPPPTQGTTPPPTEATPPPDRMADPAPITDAAWQAWLDLVKRAVENGVGVPGLAKDTSNMGILRAAYGELDDSLKKVTEGK